MQFGTFMLVCVLVGQSLWVSGEEIKTIDLLQKVASQAVSEYELTVLKDTPAKATLTEKPVVRFVMERCEGAFIYLWTLDGLPVAVAQIYHRRFPRRPVPLWLHQFRSLTADSMELRKDSAVMWQPKSAGLKWESFPSAPEPSCQAVGRRSQRKQLSRLFEATEIMGGEGNEREYQLTRKPRELFVYQSESEGQKVDGSIFWFARDDGNDPELLLMVEAVGETKPERWRFALVPFTPYQVNVQFEDEPFRSFPNLVNQTQPTEPNHIWSFNATEE